MEGHINSQTTTTAFKKFNIPKNIVKRKPGHTFKDC